MLTCQSLKMMVNIKKLLQLDYNNFQDYSDSLQILAALMLCVDS